MGLLPQTCFLLPSLQLLPWVSVSGTMLYFRGPAWAWDGLFTKAVRLQVQVCSVCS